MEASPKLRSLLHASYDERAYWSHFAREWGQPVPAFEERDRLLLEAARRAGGERGAFSPGGSGRLARAVREVVQDYFSKAYRDEELLELPDA